MNTAAFNRIDEAEDEFDEALRANAAGPHVLARAGAASRAALLHVSTDYVFDGEKGEPYVESDQTHPMSIYGATKLAGEHAVAAAIGVHHFELGVTVERPGKEHPAAVRSAWSRTVELISPEAA